MGQSRVSVSYSPPSPATLELIFSPYKNEEQILCQTEENQANAKKDGEREGTQTSSQR
jgi:hypothetical protein